MNKKIIFLFLTIFSFFVANVNVFAIAPIGWADNFNYYGNSSISIHDSNGWYTRKDFGLYSTDNEKFYYSSPLDFSNGVSFIFSYDLVANFLYEANIYYCSSSVLNFYPYVAITGFLDDVLVSTTSNTLYTSSSYFDLSNEPFTAGTKFNSCRYATISFVPSKHSTYLSLFLKQNVTSSFYLFDFKIEPVGYYMPILDLSVNFDNINQNIDNSTNQIKDNQNSNTQQQISNENKNHDETMNADSESSFKGDNGSVDNYNQAESDLMDSIDVNLDDIGLDLSNYTKPFSWIWQQVDKLLNLNPKVFGCVIAVLTFGFIGLVINR